MTLSKQGTKFQAVAVIQARGDGELVCGIGSSDSKKGLCL